MAASAFASVCFACHSGTYIHTYRATFLGTSASLATLPALPTQLKHSCRSKLAMVIGQSHCGKYIRLLALCVCVSACTSVRLCVCLLWPHTNVAAHHKGVEITAAQCSFLPCLPYSRGACLFTCETCRGLSMMKNRWRS